MPEVPPVEDAARLEAIEPALRSCEEKGTPGRDFVRVLGHRPAIARSFVENWNAAFYEGDVDHRLKELVRLRLAQLHGCSFCLSVGSEPAREMGLSDEKVDALDAYRTDDRFTDRERAALGFAEDFFENDHDYADLYGAFDDAEVVELAWFTALQDASQKFVHDLGLEAEACDRPAPSD